VTEERGHSALRGVADELSRQCPEVDVGPVLRPGQRDRIRMASSGRHQWQPPRELVVVGDEFHRREQRVVDQRDVAALQIVDVGLALDEADMRNRVEETAHIGQQPVGDRVGPKLARHLKLLVDLDRLADVDRAVGPLRGVVQLAQPCVTSACVVPRAAALGGRTDKALDQGDRPTRLYQPQERAQRGTHDSRAHQNDVRLCGLRVRHRIVGPSRSRSASHGLPLFRLSAVVCLHGRRSAAKRG